MSRELKHNPRSASQSNILFSRSMLNAEKWNITMPFFLDHVPKFLNKSPTPNCSIFPTAKHFAHTSSPTRRHSGVQWSTSAFNPPARWSQWRRVAQDRVKHANIDISHGCATFPASRRKDCSVLCSALYNIQCTRWRWNPEVSTYSGPRYRSQGRCTGTLDW